MPKTKRPTGIVVTPYTPEEAAARTPTPSKGRRRPPITAQQFEREQAALERLLKSGVLSPALYNERYVDLLEKLRG